MSILNKNKKLPIKYIILISLIICIISFLAYRYICLYKFNIDLEEAAKIPHSTWDKKYQDIDIKNQYKVVILTKKGGEYSYAEYFKYSAERMGWKVNIYLDNITGYEHEILAFDPDFILFSEQTRYPNHIKIESHRSKKYLTSFIPYSLKMKQSNKSIINPYTPIKYFLSSIISAHAVLSPNNEVGIFKQIFTKFNKTFNGLGLLCTAPKLENKPAEPKNLMWIGMGWDKFRSSRNYKKFITLLNDNVPMKVYGSYRVFSYLKPHIYDGHIAPGIDNIEAIRKNGIYLLTHSDFHIKASNPSVRLFEATAANAIIISDMNPFTIKNFGDNILYFDQTADAETMYKQVKAHIDWIKENPEEAKSMANRAHKIFLENFTLEKDLIRIAKMHEYILKEEKEMGLSYPLAY